MGGRRSLRVGILEKGLYLSFAHLSVRSQKRYVLVGVGGRRPEAGEGSVR